jgi:hypothetical protein
MPMEEQLLNVALGVLLMPLLMIRGIREKTKFAVILMLPLSLGIVQHVKDFCHQYLLNIFYIHEQLRIISIKNRISL